MLNKRKKEIGGFHKYLIPLLLCGVFLFFCGVRAQAQELPSISAQSAELLVADTGEFLFEKNAQQQRGMASTTKIMTSLLAVEESDPNRVITATEAMVRVEGTSIGLQAGDKITLRNLIYGMLLESGNDAANATAIALAGSADQFAERMNARAKEIGMTNTHFVTPSGLDHEEHYSCAHDMALLGAEAIQNPEFAAVCSTKSIRVAYGNPEYLRTLRNHNRLLSAYPGCIGVKTGFTKKSGRCLVSAARRDGVTLVAVTLNAPNDWDDHKKLFDYGFSVVENLKLDDSLSGIQLKVVGGVSKSVPVECAITPSVAASDMPSDIHREIRLEPFVYAPVERGRIVGEARYYRGDQLLACVPLETAQAVKNIDPPKQTEEPEKEKKGFWNQIKEWFSTHLRREKKDD